MKIKSIKIEKHKIFGNLELDFTDKNGNAYNTIIFIGENGVGKTTLLDFISTIFQAKTSKDVNINNDCTFDVSLEFTDEELKDINDNIAHVLGTSNTHLDDNNIVIKYMPIDVRGVGKKYVIPNILSNHVQIVLSTLDKICPTIYSPAQTNLQCRDIISTTTKIIDDSCDKSIKATENLGQEIKQMFVDIEANDSSDLSNWVINNPNCIPPEEVVQIRIKRFNRAFSKIFSDNLKFDRVQNMQNKKEIYFKNNGDDVAIDNLSSGQKQIIYRGAFFLKDKKSICGSIALIDEPEISLHPKWQIDILDYYKFLFQNENAEQTSQIFLSSHSEYVFKAKTTGDLILILYKDNTGDIKVKPYEKQNILPFNSFAENKYFAFDIPTLEFFNELYAYIGWKANMKVDNCILQFKAQISSKYLKYCNLIQWKKDNGKIVQISPITYIRHEIHHPENHLNKKLYNNDEDLREPIEFMLYLIKTFNI